MSDLLQPINIYLIFLILFVLGTYVVVSSGQRRSRKSHRSSTS